MHDAGLGDRSQRSDDLDGVTREQRHLRTGMNRKKEKKRKEWHTTANKGTEYEKQWFTRRQRAQKKNIENNKKKKEQRKKQK